MFGFGDATYFGSLPADHIAVSDVVGMLATPDSAGYRLFGADGAAFDFGATVFLGSLPGEHVYVSDVTGASTATG
jgi:hypothetical protein